MSAPFLTDESDIEKLDECAPMFRPLAAFVLYESQRHLDEVEPGRFITRLAVAARSAKAQWDAYAKGRKRLKSGLWEVVDASKVVTNATPEDAAHCIVASDGVTPAAMAADFWVLHRDSGKMLESVPRLHPAWSVIPWVAYCAPGDVVVSGAGFKSIRGGDWPHVELVGWSKLVEKGRLK